LNAGLVIDHVPVVVVESSSPLLHAAVKEAAAMTEQ
jgi:hypothetical protein